MAPRITPTIRAAALARVAANEAPPWTGRRERSTLDAADRSAWSTLTAAERDAVTAIVVQWMLDRTLGRPVTPVPEVTP